MPKLFKWYKDDFGFSKQEIMAYYASFMPVCVCVCAYKIVYIYVRMRARARAGVDVDVCAAMSLISSLDTQPDVRANLTEIAQSNNFIIKYDKFDWNLNLSQVCTDATNKPRQLLGNGPPSSMSSPARPSSASMPRQYAQGGGGGGNAGSYHRQQPGGATAGYARAPGGVAQERPLASPGMRNSPQYTRGSPQYTQGAVHANSQGGSAYNQQVRPGAYPGETGRAKGICAT